MARSTDDARLRRGLQTYSTAAASVTDTTIGSGLANASSFTPTTAHRYMAVVANSTNSLGFRITASTAESGIALSSREVSLVPVVGGQTYFLYTTGSSGIAARVVFV